MTSKASRRFSTLGSIMALFVASIAVAQDSQFNTAYVEVNSNALSNVGCFFVGDPRRARPPSAYTAHP